MADQLRIPTPPEALPTTFRAATWRRGERLPEGTLPDPWDIVYVLIEDPSGVARLYRMQATEPSPDGTMPLMQTSAPPDEAGHIPSTAQLAAVLEEWETPHG